MNKDLDKAKQEIEELRRLEYGWDDYDSPPPDAKCIDEAEAFIEKYYHHSRRYRTVPSHVTVSADDGVTVMYFERMSGFSVTVNLDFDPDHSEILMVIQIRPDSLHHTVPREEREREWKRLETQGKWGQVFVSFGFTKDKENEMFVALDGALDRIDHRWVYPPQ